MFYSDAFPCQRWIWIDGDSDFNSQNSDSPQARFSAASWNSTNSLFLFGGNAGGSQYLNDFWRYDLFSDVWKLLSGNRSDSNYPVPRIGSVGWRWSDQSFLFGGFNTNGYLNDFWVFDEHKNLWTKLLGSDGYNENSYKGFLGARSSSTLWQNNNDVFLFGGVGPFVSDKGAIQFNDLWRFNTSDKTWVLIADNNFQSDNATCPAPRSAAASWRTSDNLLLFGGINSSSQLLNDFWSFSVTAKKWSLISSDTRQSNYGTRGISSDTNQPGGRSAPFFWTINDSLLFLFGGYGYDQRRSTGQLNDLWVFDTTTKNWTWLSGSSDINNLGRHYTSQGQMSALNQPCSRFGGVSWTVNSDRFLFGGSQNSLSDQLKNDLWKCISLTNCPLEIDIDQQTNVSGFGRSDGSVSIVVSGGYSPYSYLWNTGSTATSLSNLMASDYTLTVVGINSDQVTRTVSISQPRPLTVRIAITDSDKARAIGSDGVPPYAYCWDNGDTTADTQGLLAGQHIVVVMDSISDIASDRTVVPGATYLQSDIVRLKTVDISRVNLVSPWNSSDSSFCVGSTYLASFYLSVVTPVSDAKVSVSQNNIVIFESDLLPGFQTISLKAPQNPGNYALVFTAIDVSGGYSANCSASLNVQDKRVLLSDVRITSDAFWWDISGWEIDTINSQRIVKIFNDNVLFFSDLFNSDSIFPTVSFNSTDFEKLGVITVEAYRSDTPYCKSVHKFQYNGSTFATPTVSLSDISPTRVTAETIFHIPLFVNNSLADNVNFNVFLGNKQYSSSGINGQNTLHFQAPDIPSDYPLTITASIVDLPDITSSITTIVSVVATPIVTFRISDTIVPGCPYNLMCSVNIPGGTTSDYVEIVIGSSNVTLISDLTNNTQCMFQLNVSFCGNLSCAFTDPRTGDYYTQYIPISLKPSVDAGSDKTVSLGNTINLGVGSKLSDVLYTWSPSDGIYDIHAFPAQVIPISDRTYTVVAQRTNMSDCFASDSVKVTVEPFVLSDVSGSLFIWTGESFNTSFYINGAASVSITTGWGYSDVSDFGSGIGQFNIQTPLYLSDTNYSYNLTATNLFEPKSYSYSDPLYVESISLSDFSVKPSVSCASGVFVVACSIKSMNILLPSVLLTVRNGSDVIIYSDKSDLHSDQKSMSWTVSAPSVAGNYDIILKAIDNNHVFCVVSDSIVIKAPVVVNAGSDQKIVQYQAITLGAGSAESDVLYIWSPSDGISDIHAFPTYAIPLSDKIYTVIAQRTDVSDCVASDSVNISVEPFVLSDVSGSLFIWTGESFNPSFYINSPASVSITTGWGYSDISDFESGVGQFSIQTPLSLSGSNYGCTITATSLLNLKSYSYSDTLYVESMTLSDFSVRPSVVCASGVFVVTCSIKSMNTLLPSVLLTVRNGSDVIIYSDKSDLHSDQKNMSWTVNAPSVAGNYDIILKAIDNNHVFCIVSDSITVKSPIAVDAGSDQRIVQHQAITLGMGSAQSDVLYTWSPSDGISDIHAFPARATPLSDKTYTVVAQRTDVSDCVASDSVKITVEIPNFEVTLTADTYKTSAGSDVFLGIIIQNKGTVTTLPTHISTTLTYSDSDYPLSLIEKISDLKIPALAPQQSDFLTYKINPTAGKFDITTTVQTYPFASDSIIIEAEGTSSYAQARYKFSGSFLEIIFELPSSFMVLYTNLNSGDCQLLFSDMYEYVQTSQMQIGLKITKHSDVFSSDNAKILKAESSVAVSGLSDNLYFSNSNFTFGIENFMSDNVIIYYSDDGSFVSKPMSDLRGTITIIPVAYQSVQNGSSTEKADQKTALRTILFVFACLGLLFLLFIFILRASRNLFGM